MTAAGLRIDLETQPLDTGAPHEAATFGLLEVTAAGKGLTACISVDSGNRQYRDGPCVSGYHLAEWLVWNWWRLRWEPRPPVRDVAPPGWDMAHCMATIGEGYVWPNITFASDGFQCDVLSDRSDETDAPRFFYLGAPRAVSVSSVDFEREVDQFIGRILELVSGAGLADTNLQTLWHDLGIERNTPELARFRRLEALLGFDPDAQDAELIENRLTDAPLLGDNALAEIVTCAAEADGLLTARKITEITAASAFDMNPDAAFRLNAPMMAQWGNLAAWRIGVNVADTVRQESGLSNQPIADAQLADLAGISRLVLDSELSTDSLSWIFHQPGRQARVALRSKWKTNRRFDLARLIGDRLFADGLHEPTEPLLPATRSHSYRQKAQRAFAAQLLSPWEAVRDMLGNDCSQENQEQVAEHFAVSSMTIRTLLDNHPG